MHVFTIEELQDALDIAKKIQNIEKDEETAYAQRKNTDNGIGEYQKTMNDYRKDLKIAFEQAILYYENGEYQNAIGCSREVLVTAQKVGDKVGEGRAFAVMAQAYDDIGEYDKAIDCYRKFLEIAEELGDKEWICGVHSNMGNAYNEIGEYHKAIDCYRKHLDIAVELGDRGGIGRAHSHMGNAYYNIGEYHKAIDCHRKDLEIAEWLGDKVGIGRAHSNMGIAYDNIGEYQKAIDCHRKHLEIAEELGDKKWIGGAHGNMGISYDNIGEYHKAIDCHRKALEIAVELGYREGIGTAHGNMGKAYNSIGEYHKAIDCHRKDLEIAKELGDKRMIGRAHGNMGVAYGSIGEYPKAIDCHRKTLKIFEELGDKRGIGNAHACMGNEYDNIGEFHKAIDCFRKYLEITEEIGDRGGVGIAHGNMGNAYACIGEYHKAFDCLRKGLEIAEELGEKGNICHAHGNMGVAYYSVGEYQKAIECQRKSLEIAEELGTIHDVAMRQRNLGNFYQRNNDRVACSFFAKSMLSYQKIRRFGVFEDELNTSMSNLFSKVHKHFFISLLNLKQVKLALLVSDSGKAKALYDLTRRWVDVVVNPVLDENFAIAIQAIADDPCLKTNEAFFDIILSELIGLMRDENIISYTFDRQHNLHAWVISRKGVFHKTWKTANGMSTKIYGQTLNRGIQECLMRNLPKNVSLSPRPSERYNIGGNAKINHLDHPLIGNKDDRGNKFTRNLEERVENLTRIDGNTKSSEENEEDTKRVVGWYSLERPNVSESRVKNGTDHRRPQLKQDTYETNLEKLYSIYISPIEEYLVGSKILIVPEGSLFEVQFCALLNSKKEHLCDRYSLQFTPALHVLNASLSKPLPKIGPALFVGNPIVGDVIFNDVLTSIPQLAMAKVGAEECSEYFNAEPLLDEKATKENVLKDMKDASVIHIAAHGDMDHADIFLAPNEGAPKPPSEEHYLLTAKDVVKCTLQARLVVLSCCHSGRGQISAEGVVGIARSFLGAGARSVLVSLWRILDEETMEFMKLFYEKVIQGVSVCVALQQAMIEMKKKYRMATWSYFQIVGEDISLSQDEIEEIRRQSSAN